MKTSIPPALASGRPRWCVPEALANVAPLSYEEAWDLLQARRDLARKAQGRRTSRVKGVWEHEYLPIFKKLGWKMNALPKPRPLRNMATALPSGLYVVKVTCHLCVVQVDEGIWVRDQCGTFPIELSRNARKLARWYLTRRET